MPKRYIVTHVAEDTTVYTERHHAIKAAKFQAENSHSKVYILEVKEAYEYVKPTNGRVKRSYK